MNIPLTPPRADDSMALFHFEEDHGDAKLP
jgi:hypothetical protein